MENIKVDVMYGSKEKGNAWELKGVEVECPTTLQEWSDWIGLDKVLRMLKTYFLIRLQDFCRRLHAGTKNQAPKKDADILTLAASFRPFEKTMVLAAPRAMTPAELKAHLLTMSPEDRAAYLKELMAE